MSLKVLIVDDDKMIKLVHKMMVLKSGLCTEPLVFDDGKSAFDFLVSKHTDFDNYLVLLDINMPIMNGWEFLDAIQGKEFEKKLIVVMVTSSVDTGDRNKAKEYPQIIDFLEKPLKVDACNYIKNLPSIAPLL